MSFEEDLNKGIGERLQEQRVKLKHTQASLAHLLMRMGVPLAQQTIAKIENGSRPMKLAEAQAIATILGLEVQDLVPGDEAEEKLYQLELLIADVVDLRERLLELGVRERHAVDKLKECVAEIKVTDYGDRPGEFATAIGTATNLIEQHDDSAP
ncbi:helix-turn-helix transcriptional regulator [Gordonia phthalatica]|uniref:HTH cro/C1-type domain-containing protein n=1 Tax=Gordonia phthalatica TaxID=1136941 RepID=A0A0N7FV07_9ACTN|nr:helix-turn-helix transcriptional regulator [Gordonia phthalatica]ALG85831.1 hypothetical protein ACH46_16735 [Gordonia phthalatica]